MLNFPSELFHVTRNGNKWNDLILGFLLSWEKQLSWKSMSMS